jgi:hypothetical protein
MYEKAQVEELSDEIPTSRRMRDRREHSAQGTENNGATTKDLFYIINLNRMKSK